ncbi:MAG: hypothetical protein ACC656_14775, partial [Candidatus Heimdallarchaeota archaeon]
LFNDPPSVDFAEFDIPKDVVIEIEEVLNEINISEIEEGTIQFNLNNMKSKFEYLIYKYPENEELKNLIENNYFEWIDELSRRL